MDHLPTPLDRGHHETVKFFHGSKSTFSPGDFFTIPADYGYYDEPATDQSHVSGKSLLRDGLYKPITVTQANEFLQDWLFFGLLADVSGQTISAKEFYDGESNIHTENLNQILQKWGATVRSDDSQTPEQRMNQYIHGVITLDYARAFVSKHLAHRNMDGEPNRPLESKELQGIHAKVNPNLTLSIAILGETLQKARLELAPDLQGHAQFWANPNAPDQSWGNSVRNRQLMINRGWCPRDIRRIEATMPGVTGVYYASHVEAMKSEVNHVEHGCTSWDCKVIAPELKPLHSSGCRSQACTPINIAEQELDIVEYLDKDFTPLVTWDRTTGQATLEYHDLATSQIRFGALSHGWSENIFEQGQDADGGHSRRVFKCQLRNLQESFNHLIRDRHNDDLVRVDSSRNTPFFLDVLCFPRRASKTATALAQLKTIFQKAECVIVWDRNLLGQQLKDEDKLIEMNVRILTGAWARRLWTLQEAVLAQNLQFQFAGSRSFLSINALEDAMIKAKGKMDIGHPYHHVWRCGRPLSPAVDGLRRAGKESRVARLWQAVQFRQCATPEDEPLILANVLGLVDLAMLDNIIEGTKREIANSRMATFLELIDLAPGLGIPSGIIFVPGPKLISKQAQVRRVFAWAPMTWLSQQMNNLPLLCRNARLMRHGLEVQFPGIRVHLPLNAIKEPMFWLPTHPCLHKWFKVKVDIADGAWEQFYQDHILTAEEPCIILSAQNPKTDWEIGLLVGSKGYLHDNVRWVHVLERVWIRLETDTDIIHKMQSIFRQKRDWMVFGEKLSKHQNWCIDDGHILNK